MIQNDTLTYTINTSYDTVGLTTERTAETKTFFTPAGDLGVIISNGIEEPTHYDGTEERSFEDYVFCGTVTNWEHDTTSAGHRWFVLYDSSQTLTANAWNGYLLKITKSANDDLKDDVHMIADNGDHWIRLYYPSDTTDTPEGYCVMGGIDWGASVCTTTATGAACDAGYSRFGFRTGGSCAAGLEQAKVVEFLNGNLKGTIRHAYFE